MAEVCIDLKDVNMEDIEILSGGLDFYQEFMREEKGIDVDMKTIVFSEKDDGTIMICGESQDLDKFKHFITKVINVSDSVGTAVLRRFAGLD